MKTFFRIIILSFFLSALISSHAQTTVTIGSGTTETYTIPVNIYYGYTYSQQIVLQSEIAVSGDITRLYFYMLGGVDLTFSSDWTVYMGHTSKTGFTSSGDWINLSNLTQVFSGTISTMPAAGWYEIVLDNPFPYNNTDNLAIAIDENADDYDDNENYTRIWTPSGGSYRSIYYYSDDTNPDPASPPTATSRQTFMNQMQLFVQPPNSVQNPSGFTAVCPNAPDAINLSWTKNGNDDPVLVVYNTVSTFGAPVNGSTYSINDVLSGGGTVIYNGPASTFTHQSLNPSTEYFYKAWSVDASDNYSNGTTVVSATTACEALVIPYNEVFDDFNFPECWTQTATTGLGNRWDYAVSDYSGGTTNEMFCDYVDEIGIARLISPPLNTTGLSALQLSFLTFFDDYGSGLSLKIQSSQDLINWTDEWTYGSGSGDIPAGTEITVNINNNLNGTTYLAWVTDGDHYQYDAWYIDEVEIKEPTDMVFVSATSFQNNTLPLIPGATGSEILGLEIITEGTLNPLVLNTLYFNTNGTTNTADLDNAKLWYSEDADDFTSAYQVGNVNTSPNGLITFSSGPLMPISLLEGANYFWLTYDIAAGAQPGRFVDASCDSLKLGITTYIPDIQSPAGNREIKASLSGLYTIDNTLPTGGTNFNNFTDAVNDLNVLGISGAVTFNVVSGQVHDIVLPFGTLAAFTINTTGTAAQPIVFQKYGSGNNPLINVTGNNDENHCFILPGIDYITFDGIDIMNQGSNANDYLETGFLFIGADADNGCNHVTVKNCSITLSRFAAPSAGIYLLANNPSAPENANNYNSFLNNNISEAQYAYFFGGSSQYPDMGNVIGTENGGSSALERIGNPSSGNIIAAIFATYQKDFSINEIFIDDVKSNNICAGMYLQELSGNGTISLCGINDVASASTSQTYGMYLTSASGSVTCDGNAINGITGNGNATGISSTGSADFVINGNYISGVTRSASTSYQANGLVVNGGDTNTIYNNFIFDISAPASSTSTIAVSGIYLNGGTLNNVYHNSVYLNYTSTNTNHRCGAVFITGSALNNDLRNNIFVNTVNVSTGARAAAFYKATSSLGNLSLSTSNNLFYAGTPSSKNLLYYDNSLGYQTIEAYRTKVAPRDQWAVSEMPPFISATTPVDLHLDNTIATQAESGGAPFTNPIDVATDIDGQSRFGKPGYSGSGSAPDIGADEFDGVVLDLFPPIISYTPLSFTSSLTNRPLNGVEISDNSGISMAAGLKPRLYYKKTSQPNDSASWKYTEAVLSGSIYDFVFDYTAIGGVSVGDTIQYFVVAQDLASTPNVGIHKGSFATGQQSVALKSGAFPIGGTINYYVIYNTLSGTVTVGTGGDYTSLTGAGGLFQTINSTILTGHVTAKITSNLSENGTHALLEFMEEGPGNYTLTIEPANDTEKLINGPAANGGMIRFSGADRVTVRGYYTGLSQSYGRYLRFRNTHTTNPAFSFINGAQFNTIQDVIIESSNTSTQGAVSFNSGNNSNNIFNNCIIQNNTGGSGRPEYGFYINDLANSSISILNCAILNFNVAGINAYLANNLLVEGCTIAAPTATYNTGIIGIYLANANGTVIRKNKIYDLRLAAGGQASGIQFNGMTSQTVSITIENNIIAIEPVTTGRVTGIYFNANSSSSAYIYHNSIYIGGSLASGSEFSAGICKTQTAQTFIQLNNTVFNNRVNNGGSAYHYAVYYSYPQSATINLDYNNYYCNSSGGGKLGLWLSNYFENLPDWQFTTNHDAHSMSSDPLYSSATDLSPLPASPLKGKGTGIPSVSDDIAGTVRHPDFPTPGAYEIPLNNLEVSTPGFVVGTDQSYDYIIVEPQGQLTLSSGTILSAGLDFIIESDATGTGSFVQLGTLNVSGTTSVQKFLPNTTVTGWNISVPVQTAPVEVFDGSDEIYFFNSASAGWESQYGYGNMLPMRGYVVRFPDTKRITFSGTMNSGTMSRTDLLRTTTPNNFGWNFIGNPYPSPIDWNANPGISSTNLNSAIYFRKADGNVASYVSGVGTNGGSNIIPSMQAFWVQVTQGQTIGTLEITPDAQIHATNNTYKSEAQNVLRLSLTQDGASDETVIRFNTGATDGFDGAWDAFKMFSESLNSVHMASLSGTEILSVNTLPVSNEAVSVPLHITGNNNTPSVISASGMTSFEKHPDIVLEDSHTETFTKLRTQSTYSFSGSSNDQNRFFVHFIPAGALSSGDEDSAHTPHIFANGNTLYISGIENDNTQLSVFNPAGQEVLNTSLNKSGLHKVNTDLSMGCYVVKLTGKTQSVSKVIFINNNR